MEKILEINLFFLNLIWQEKDFVCLFCFTAYQPHRLYNAESS